MLFLLCMGAPLPRTPASTVPIRCPLGYFTPLLSPPLPCCPLAASHRLLPVRCPLAGCWQANQPHTFVVVTLDTPIRKGNTSYHHVVVQVSGVFGAGASVGGSQCNRKAYEAWIPVGLDTRRPAFWARHGAHARSGGHAGTLSQGTLALRLGPCCFSVGWLPGVLHRAVSQ